MVENAVERSLEAAEENLESVQQFADANKHALTEEEYLAWAAKATQSDTGSCPKDGAEQFAPLSRLRRKSIRQQEPNSRFR